MSKSHQSERPDKPWDTIHIGLVNRFLTVTYIYSLMNLWWTKVPCIKIPKVHSELKTSCVKYFPFIAFCSEHPVVDPKLMKQKHLLQRGGNSAVWCITLLPPLRRRNAFLLHKIEKKKKAPRFIISWGDIGSKSCSIIVIRNEKIVWKHGPYLAEFWY